MFHRSFSSFVFFEKPEHPSSASCGGNFYSCRACGNMACLADLRKAGYFGGKYCQQVQAYLKLLWNKYYIDNIYSWLFHNIMILIGDIFDWIDHKLIDASSTGWPDSSALPAGAFASPPPGRCRIMPWRCSERCSSSLSSLRLLCWEVY